MRWLLECFPCNDCMNLERNPSFVIGSNIFFFRMILLVSCLRLLFLPQHLYDVVLLFLCSFLFLTHLSSTFFSASISCFSKTMNSCRLRCHHHHLLSQLYFIFFNFFLFILFSFAHVFPPFRCVGFFLSNDKLIQ